MITVSVDCVTGLYFTVQVFAEGTVDDLKYKIWEKEGIPPSQQSLIYRSVELSGDRPLSLYGITNAGCRVYLAVAAKSGPSSSKFPAAADRACYRKLLEVLQKSGSSFLRSSRFSRWKVSDSRDDDETMQAESEFLQEGEAMDTGEVLEDATPGASNSCASRGLSDQHDRENLRTMQRMRDLRRSLERLSMEKSRARRAALEAREAACLDRSFRMEESDETEVPDVTRRGKYQVPTGRAASAKTRAKYTVPSAPEDTSAKESSAGETELEESRWELRPDRRAMRRRPDVSSSSDVEKAKATLYYSDQEQLVIAEEDLCSLSCDAIDRIGLSTRKYEFEEGDLYHSPSGGPTALSPRSDDEPGRKSYPLTYSEPSELSSGMIMCEAGDHRPRVKRKMKFSGPGTSATLPSGIPKVHRSEALPIPTVIRPKPFKRLEAESIIDEFSHEGGSETTPYEEELWDHPGASHWVEGEAGFEPASTSLPEHLGPISTRKRYSIPQPGPYRPGRPGDLGRYVPGRPLRPRSKPRGSITKGLQPAGLGAAGKQASHSLRRRSTGESSSDEKESHSGKAHFLPELKGKGYKKSVPEAAHAKKQPSGSRHVGRKSVQAGSSLSFRHHRPPQSSQSQQRCNACGYKLSISHTFACRCGKTFCSRHKSAEAHACSYDARKVALLKEQQKS